MAVSRHIPTRAGAALVAAGALAGATVALASGATGHAARSASAQATAYSRDSGDGNPHAYVTVSGNGSRTARGTAASASTANYKGTATAGAHVNGVSLLGGMVTADKASVSASASGNRATETGKVTNLIVSGESKGSPTSRVAYPVQDYGKLVVLDASARGITALKVKLTRAYGAYPAGTTIRIAYASASARDGVAPQPTATTPKPAKPKPPAAASKPAQPKKPAAKKPRRRKPPRTRALLTARGFVFPVYGKHNFTDTFGAARADTGTHEGNDIFAASGTPLVAVCDGSLNRVGTLPISGNRLWVKCNTGDSFFYAHLSAFAAETRNGLRVKAGQVVGFVGSTGDAEQTPPHCHFEVHPGDGAAVDPYPFLRAWESHRDVPAAAWVRQNGQVGQQPGTLVVLKDFIDR